MDLGPFGYKAKKEDDEYESLRKRHLEEENSQTFVFEKDEPLVREVLKETKVRTREAMPRFEDENIEPFKRVSPEIVGSIFDRVKFLSERITEVQESIRTREGLHQEMVKEIIEDIREKETMMGKAMDLDETRNLKLDISLLRREKRNEGIRFWKDVMELRSELRELTEAFHTESRIVKIFGKEGGQDEI